MAKIVKGELGNARMEAQPLVPEARHRPPLHSTGQDRCFFDTWRFTTKAGEVGEPAPRDVEPSNLRWLKRSLRFSLRAI